MASRISYNGEFISFEWQGIGTDDPLFNTAGFLHELEGRLRTEMQREAEIVKRAFERTTATWNTPVEFTIKKSLSSNSFAFTVSTNSDIYAFVNNGTIVRYATMTPDFSPKTHIRVIGSGSGEGGLMFVNRNYPQPGIEAREFDLEIAERRDPYFQAHMSDIFTKIVDKYWERAHSR
jgi:hypothetical protein